jgi:hypothetical protein
LKQKRINLMTLQNRVTPFGEILAIPQRGMFTGNRGIIHDPRTRTLLKRRWTSKAWIVCSLEYKNARRDVMATRSWTELFFLDEATALAAGHRPCFLCRREAAERYRRAWAAAAGAGNTAAAAPSASAIDAVLHAERLQDGRKRLHEMKGDPLALPDGAMVSVGSDAYLIAGAGAWRWAPSGYEAPIRLERADGLLTPPSTLAALEAGYRPAIHASSSETLMTDLLPLATR